VDATMMRGATPWIITRKHPPAVGGMEELSYRVAEQLALRRPLTLVRWGRSQFWLLPFILYAGLRLAIGIARRRVSVVLLGDPVLAALAVVARRFDVPVLVVVHGLDVIWRNALYQAYLRRCFWGRMDAYICISNFAAALVRARNIAESSIFVIPAGVVVPAAAAPAAIGGDPVLLLIGRLVPRKGAAWFLDAVLPGLVARMHSVKVLIAGEGPDRDRIERLARSARLADNVELVGPVSEARKWSLLARCDLVIMPNTPTAGDAEGFGIVALEAGASGKAVVAADLEGLRDAVVEGVNGWRLPPQDAAAWVEALSTRLSDRAALLAMGERARSHVAANHAWTIIGDRYAAVLDRYAPR
jgi:phosphatidylinositol alpha-1,6-mannosyltransferase